MKSRLTPKYIQLRDLYQDQFSGAYRFLCALETDITADIWLGTAVNVNAGMNM